MPWGLRRIPSREERLAARQERMAAQVATVTPLRRGVMDGSTTGPDPKPEPRYVDQALTDMAKDRPCLLLVPAVCNHRVDTTVACHSNWREHGGKGERRKADDTYSVWGCSACHYWLDFGKADGPAKQRVFMLAHANQVLAWRLVATDHTEPERFRRAARRALEHLNAMPAPRLGLETLEK